MTKRPQVVHTLTALDRSLARLRKSGKVALVPTMGALHAGHLALVRVAHQRANSVVVSIFVNPTQFAPHEDFATYPRTLATDVEALAPLGVDVIWAPPPELMYPPGFATRVMPEGAAVAGLEDRFRPHFFAGVATVVTKLFTQCRPDLAMFGEKDFQQLRVVTRLAQDLDLRVEVVGVPTVRDRDGLALSSRNAYLSPQERETAPTLHRVLGDCAAKIRGGAVVAEVLAEGRSAIEHVGFVVDYLEARHAETLAPVCAPGEEPVRLLVAARLGTTRLIDNIGV